MASGLRISYVWLCPFCSVHLTNLFNINIGHCFFPDLAIRQDLRTPVNLFNANVNPVGLHSA